MFVLKNDDLLVELLSPITNADRLGNRYAHGGYIWAVRNTRSGEDLISGPCFPDPTPPIFDGQGLPEVFRYNDKDTNAMLMGNDAGKSMIVGIGKAQWGDDVEVVEKVSWNIDEQADVIVFSCKDAHEGWAYELTRTVKLEGTSISVNTSLSSTGEKPLQMEWYAHPFFQVGSMKATLEFHAGMHVPEGRRGYDQQGQTVSFTDEGKWGDGGEFCWLEDTPVKTSEPLMRVALSKQQIDFSFTGDVDIARIALWANENTVSLEPYIKFDLAPGDAKSWETSYAFIR